MISKLWVVMLSLLIAGPAFADRASQIEQMKKQTVLVTNEGFLGGGRGSGLLMDADHVLTCAHMVSGPDDELFIYTYPFGQVVKGHVQYVNLKADLLLVKLDSPVKFAKTPRFQGRTYDGEPLTIIGNAMGGMKWYVTAGVVSGQERDYIMTDAPVNHGNSGGPWFNDKGEVVALTDWKLSKGEGLSGGIAAKTIDETFEGWLNSQKMMGALMQLFGGAK